MEYSVQVAASENEMRDVSLLIDPTGEKVETHGLGVIVTYGSVHLWKPMEDLPYGLVLAPTAALRDQFIIEHLEWMVKTQIEAREKGEKPDLNTLHPDLRQYLRTDTAMPMLRHPYLFLHYNPGMDADTNGTYNAKKQMIEGAVASEDWVAFIAYHEKAYRATALAQIAQKLSDTKYWRLMADVWTNTEGIWENQEIWRALWSSDRQGRDKLMKKSQRKKLEAMPEKITIYRGISHHDAIEGMSWTISEKRARWFAERFSASTKLAIVAKAEVDRANVLAYFTQRSEDEIVVLPEHCHNKVGEVLFDQRESVEG